LSAANVLHYASNGLCALPCSIVLRCSHSASCAAAGLESAAYVLGAVHSDANCAILIDGLFKRTHELAVRGLTLQQRARIADHIRAHEAALEQHGHEHPVDDLDNTSKEATWKRHGAELLVARSVMNNLQEACAVAQRNEDLAAGVCCNCCAAIARCQRMHCNMLLSRVTL
jgi:hypothetical protein